MHRIYLTTNLINGKKYVGRCSSDKNWNRGYVGSGKMLKQAIEKYGLENFSREILEELPGSCSLREAIDLEKQWLIKLNCKSSPEYYNLSNDTGGMGSGDKHKEETKALIKNRMKDFYGEKGLPLEWRENVANAVRGRTPWNKGKSFKDSDDSFYSRRRAKIQLTNDDYLQIKDLYEHGMSASKIGKIWNVCHHVILGMIRRGGVSQPSNKRKAMSEEQKKKIAESLKSYHSNEKKEK